MYYIKQDPPCKMVVCNAQYLAGRRKQTGGGAHLTSPLAKACNFTYYYFKLSPCSCKTIEHRVFAWKSDVSCHRKIADVFGMVIILVVF